MTGHVSVIRLGLSNPGEASSSDLVLTSSHLNKTWTCACPLQNSRQFSQRSCLKKYIPKQKQNLLRVNKMTSLTDFYLYLKANESLSCLLLRPRCQSCWAIDSNISVDVLSLPPSLSQALFTLLLGLPSLRLNMDVWYTGRRHMTDCLLLLFSLSFQYSNLLSSFTPNLTEHIVHQLQTALRNYFLPEFLHCINIKLSPGLAPLTRSCSDWLCILRPPLYPHPLCAPRGAICCEVAYFLQRHPLCLSHALSVPGEVTWRASDYKKQR